MSHEEALEEGKWFKLICGASFQDLPTIRSLSIAYALAGADCIDVAFDNAVINAAIEGLNIAQKLAKQWELTINLPWLMVSLNDGEDPHFRKAAFEEQNCPQDCPRPCETICPALAINHGGVIDSRCYGCGRCIPVCPYQLIYTRSYVSTPSTIGSLLCEMEIDAIEIHTKVGHEEDFRRLWQTIAPITAKLKLLAISCPDDNNVLEYLKFIYDVIRPLPCLLLWQTDGRPMSGDIGRGTTHAAIEMAQKVLAADLPGYVQLAGGTNEYTVSKLQNLGLLKQSDRQKKVVNGVAYGSYARSLLLPILQEIETLAQEKKVVNSNLKSTKKPDLNLLENRPKILKEAVKKAEKLVGQIKHPN